MRNNWNFYEFVVTLDFWNRHRSVYNKNRIIISVNSENPSDLCDYPTHASYYSRAFLLLITNLQYLMEIIDGLWVLLGEWVDITYGRVGAGVVRGQDQSFPVVLQRLVVFPVKTKTKTSFLWESLNNNFVSTKYSQTLLKRTSVRRGALLCSRTRIYRTRIYRWSDISDKIFGPIVRNNKNSIIYILWILQCAEIRYIGVHL